LTQAGVPVRVLAAPIIPGLTDHEIPSIIQAAARAGARHAGYVVVRLPHGVGELFENWLGEHFPDRKKKVLNRIREIRGGKLNDRTRLEDERRGRIRGAINSMFKSCAASLGLNLARRAISRGF
jgi:DNA repair photolyase